MLSLVLLVLILESVASFTVPSRWLSARTATRRPTVACSAVNKPDEVYVGNLPPSFDESQLSKLLQQSGVTGYRDVSVLAYGTSDCEKFGNIKFDSNRLADAAVRHLSGVRVGEVAVDVSLMPKVSTIGVYIKGTDNEKKKFQNRLREVLPREFYSRVKPSLAGGRLIGALIECKSPELARRSLQLLSRSFGHTNLRLNLLYQWSLHQLVVNNLDPSIRKEDLKKIVKSVLDQDVRCRVPIMTDGIMKVACFDKDYIFVPGTNRGYAYLIFDTEEQAEVALKQLQGIKIMDRSVSISGMNQDESKVMFLGNVDPTECTESIERLCRDALGGSGEIAVNVDRRFGRFGDHYPHCKVRFDSTEARDKCMSVLNGTRWGDRVLYCARFELKQPFPELYIKSFPWSAYDNNPLRLLDSLIGEKCVKGIKMDEKYQAGDPSSAFVTVYTEDQAARAIQRLNGLVVDGTTLRVERVNAQQDQRSWPA